MKTLVTLDDVCDVDRQRRGSGGRSDERSLGPRAFPARHLGRHGERRAGQGHRRADLRARARRAVHRRAQHQPLRSEAPGRKPEIHHHRGFMSYDKARKTFMLRHFHEEGFVNLYALDSDKSMPAYLIFDSVSFENFSNEWKARESLRSDLARRIHRDLRARRAGQGFRRLQPQSFQAQEIDVALAFHIRAAARRLGAERARRNRRRAIRERRARCAAAGRRRTRGGGAARHVQRAQPRLSARHGGPHGIPRPRGGQLLELAHAHVSLRGAHDARRHRAPSPRRPTSRCSKAVSRAWASSTTCITIRRAMPYANPAETAVQRGRGGRAHGHRPHAAAGVLRAWRLRRRDAERGPAPLRHQRR